MKVSACVVVTLEMDVSDVWGGDCPMSQVSKQAAAAALARLRCGLESHPRWRVARAPRVTAVVVTEEGDARG